MPDPRYRAVTTMAGSRVFDMNEPIAACASAEWAEHIAAALNEMEERSYGDG